MPEEKVPAACRIERHVHKNGEIHLTIELMVPPGCAEFANKVEIGFNQMLEKMSGNPPIHEETYLGEEAVRKADRSIEDYYRQTLPLYDPQKMN